MSALELDPTLLEALRTLAEHDVEFVVVGDVAEAIHNDGGFVSGLAIVPGRYGRNAARLGGALQAMNAQLGIAGTPAETDVDLRRTDLRELAPCSFITRYVDIDVNFEPRGTNGYRDLFDDATHIELAAGIRPLVAAREDLARIARGSPPVALPPDLGDAHWSSQEIRASRPTRI